MTQTYQGIVISGLHENTWLVSEDQEYRQPLLCKVNIQFLDDGSLANPMPEDTEDEEIYYWSPIFKLTFQDYPDHRSVTFGVWHTDRVNLNSDSEPPPIIEKIAEIVDWINNILTPQIRTLLGNTTSFSIWPESDQLNFIKGIWELIHGRGIPMYPDSQSPPITGTLTVRPLEFGAEEVYGDDMPGMTL